jgi:predicted ester cyclase
MSLPQALTSYFKAWNDHDADRLGEMFAGGATYEDPATGGPLTGRAFASYAGALFAGFPDLHFEEGEAARNGDVYTVPWRMTGTNSAPMDGNPPTGGSVDLPGIDVITTAGGAIRSVRGYFDRQSMYEQLGLKVVPLPNFGPLQAGAGVYMSFGKTARPGAISLTVLEAPSEAERKEIQIRSTQIVMEMAQLDSFISFFGFNIGSRMCTLTAWTDPEAAFAGSRVPAHKAAARDLYNGEPGTIGSGGMLSVWAPRSIRNVVRCPSCGRWGDSVKDARCPACQAPMPPPAFF